MIIENWTPEKEDLICAVEELKNILMELIRQGKKPRINGFYVAEENRPLNIYPREYIYIYYKITPRFNEFKNEPEIDIESDISKYCTIRLMKAYRFCVYVNWGLINKYISLVGIKSTTRFIKSISKKLKNELL